MKNLKPDDPVPSIDETPMHQNEVINNFEVKKKGVFLTQEQEPLKSKEIELVPRTGDNLKNEGKNASKKNKFDFKRGYEANEHLLNLKELALKYGTHIDEENLAQSKGLEKNSIDELTKKYGMNRLTPPKQTPEIIKFLRHGLNGLNILLVGAGVLSCAAYGIDKTQPINLYLGIFLFVLVFFDMIFEYVQEASSANVMKQFKKMLPAKSKVVRSGEKDLIPALNLLPGDIVTVEGGDKIPADMRIILNKGLKVEQSALNGESEPVEVSQYSLNQSPMESRNIIFNGCLCLEGSAMGVVIRTGDETFLGLVAQQTSNIETGDTPLQKELKRFVTIISVIAVVMAIVVFIIGVGRNPDNALKYFVNGFIIIIIANVPQGLPATVISCLTIVAKRMAKENVYIKKLETIETLGSATCIASDKTGTLTMNKMTVEHLWFDQQVYSIDLLKETYKDIEKSKTFRIMLRTSGLCNKAFYKQDKKKGEMIAKNEEDDFKINVHEQESEKKHAHPEKGTHPSGTQIKSKHSVPESNNQLINSFKMASAQSFKVEPAILEKKKSSFFSKGSFASDIGSFRQQSQILVQLRENQAIETKKKIEKKTEKKKLEIVGDASETALLRFCEEFKDSDLMRFKYEKIFEVPFNSKDKYQLSIHEAFETRFLVMKGAPEIIVKLCSTYMKRGEVFPIDERFMGEFQKTYEYLGRKGERVLGAAYFDLGQDRTKYNPTLKNYPTTNLCFTGLFALMDPPKKGVAEAVSAAHRAGVKIHMVTGDHPLTGEAIARKVGIITEKTNLEIAEQKKCHPSELNPDECQAAVIYGPDLVKYSELDWENLILYKTQIVFARITPQQKVEIVSNLQKYQEIVIVTGDGVNDAIALKKADLGVAMGMGGSDVAKEAADVIFIDDNFASIINGIKEGRVLFDNLKKSIAYTITHTMPELVPVLLNIALDMPLGLGSLQILTIDLGTELGPAISMAYEYGEGDVMERLPRNVHTDKLVTLPLIGYSYYTAGVIEIVWALLAYFTVFWKHEIAATELSGIGAENFQEQDNPLWMSKFSGKILKDSEQVYLVHLCQTAYYATLVMSQVGHIWLCRTRQVSIFHHGFRNAICNYGVVLELTVLNLILWVPGLQGFFSTVNLDGIYWVQWIGAWICLFTFNELRKSWTRKYPNGKIARALLW